MTVIDEMRAIKELHNKTDKSAIQALYYKLQSRRCKHTHEKAAKVGVQFMENEERFKNFQVVMATYTDKDHIHKHFIVNSVHMENGKKYRESKYDLDKLKDYLREFEKAHHILPDLKSNEQGKVSGLNHNKYRAIKRAVEGLI